MERKVIQFQILPAKGKLWRYDDGFGNYNVGYWENMIVYLFSDGTFQCEPLYFFDCIEPADETDGHFISYLKKGDFDLEYIQRESDCTLEEAKEEVLRYIELSGIKCSDEVMDILK